MIKIRFLVVTLGFINLFNVMLARFNLNIALIQMVDQSEATETKNEESAILSCNVNNRDIEYNNETSYKGNTGEFKWNEDQQGRLLGAYIIGYMVGMIPFSYAAQQYGARYILTISCLLSGVLTLSFPMLAAFNDHGNLLASINRAVLGLAHSPVLPAQQGLLVRWSPLNEASRMLAFQGLGALIGTLVVFMFGGTVVDQLGWKMLFKICGISNIIFSVIYVVFIRNKPEECPFIQEEEKKHILLSRAPFQKAKRKIPYKAMLTSSAFWAAEAPIFNFAIMHTMANFMFPKYLNDVQGISLTLIGYLTALPSFVEFLVQIVGGVVADKLYSAGKELSFIRNVMAGIAQTIPGILLFGYFFTECNLILASALMTISLSATALQYSGGLSYVNDICPPYATAALSILNATSNIGSFFVVRAGSMFLQIYGNSIKTWSYIYGLTAFSSLVTALIFKIFSVVKIQSWAADSDALLSEASHAQ